MPLPAPGRAGTTLDKTVSFIDMAPGHPALFYLHIAKCMVSHRIEIKWGNL